MKVYHATCQITTADSEKGFWAWGRVTINLVKSADESLSHRYNQRHSRPLFPRRNSCFLWHVLKFYFKNSQHLKAECVRSPGLHWQCVFGFLNRITMFLGLTLLPSPDPHTEECSLTLWFSSERRVCSEHDYDVRRVSLFQPSHFSVKETEAERRDETQACLELFICIFYCTQYSATPQTLETNFLPPILGWNAS